MARPSCGEKSLISAGVATRQMPSTSPTTNVAMPNSHRLVVFGRMTKVKMPVKNRPITTRLARPHRSVIPANSEPNAPIRFPKARMATKNVKLMCRSARTSVDTEPTTYSS